jgi:hypothetical protein
MLCSELAIAFNKQPATYVIFVIEKPLDHGPH